MTIWILSYESSRYPEDTTILGVYSSEEKAEKAKNDAVAMADNVPESKTRSNYRIYEKILDE